MDKSSSYRIVNYGFKNQDIFRDQEDINTFLKYLNEYLNPPISPNLTKKQFVINGKAYKGSPRSNKNYYKNLELVAYNLDNTKFSLVLFQKKVGTIPSFVRSLCTRYSIYFNKKYNKKGQVFTRPYKIFPVEDLNQIPFTTYHARQDTDRTSSGIVAFGVMFLLLVIYGFQVINQSSSTASFFEIPNTNGQKIGLAKYGESFEYITVNSDNQFYTINK